MYIIDMFEKNPKAGAAGTIITFITGMVPGGIEPQIKDNVIFIFQILAFSVSILVGVFTLIGFVRKWQREDRAERQRIKREKLTDINN